MSSSSRCCATGVFVLPSLLLLPLLLSLICAAQGATLREHRLSGTEPISYGSGPPPSAEMLRALRYIQSLSQRTPPDPVPNEDQSEDMESVRSMLQMAAPSRREEKDNTQELLQAVLTTLQQTEEHMKAPQKVIATPRYAVHQYPRPKQAQVGTSAENYGRSSWANSDNRRRHRQFPLMFEEDDDDDQGQPLKRTNENAEEQYTPQKLATLQSVFEELSGIASSKPNSKREDDDHYDGKEDDLYRQRKMVLEDIMGTDDWAPLEEQMESEEEERERHGFTDDDDDDDDDVKRAVQSDWFQPGKKEEPEDIAKLVDYYLLQILEKKEQEQQKDSDREEEKKDVDEDEDEEEDLEEREVKPMQSLSDVLRISQKLRIPPEELLELLQNEKRKDLFDRKPYGSAHRTPHQRPLETSNIAQDVLSILELVNAVQQNEKRPTQAKTSRYYQRQTGRDDYDETAGEEDDIANYLASEMQRHTRDEDQPVYANLQDYYEKRPGLDNSTMMKILRYLDPESDDIEETDSEGKTVPEM